MRFIKHEMGNARSSRSAKTCPSKYRPESGSDVFVQEWRPR